MRSAVEQIDQSIDFFRATGREGLVIGLTRADWEGLCAVMIKRRGGKRIDFRLEVGLPQILYDGVMMIRLADGMESFVGFGYGTPGEQRFKLEKASEKAPQIGSDTQVTS